MDLKGSLQVVHATVHISTEHPHVVVTLHTELGSWMAVLHTGTLDLVWAISWEMTCRLSKSPVVRGDRSAHATGVPSISDVTWAAGAIVVVDDDGNVSALRIMLDAQASFLPSSHALCLYLQHILQ